MQGESIQFYIFLGVLAGGGALFLFIIKALITRKRTRERKQKVEQMVEFGPQPQTQTADISEILREVMEQIPKHSSEIPSQEKKEEPEPAVSTAPQNSEGDLR